MKNNVFEVKNISLIKNHTPFKKKNKYLHFQNGDSRRLDTKLKSRYKTFSRSKSSSILIALYNSKYILLTYIILKYRESSIIKILVDNLIKIWKKTLKAYLKIRIIKEQFKFFIFSK